jgi:hypothetical protein
VVLQILRDYYMIFSILALVLAQQRSWKTDMGWGLIPGTIRLFENRRTYMYGQNFKGSGISVVLIGPTVRLTFQFRVGWSWMFTSRPETK